MFYSLAFLISVANVDTASTPAALIPSILLSIPRVNHLSPTGNSIKKGQELFTINVHLSSEGGSSSTQGDARPPVNSLIDVRTARVASVAVSFLLVLDVNHLAHCLSKGFVKSLLAKNPLANIIVAGDFNEYLQTRSVYAPISSLLTDIDEIAKIREVERYSYVFDHNPQQLDHVLVSKAIQHRKVKFEHIHVNNWSPTLSARASDHDPSVGKIRIC